MNHLSKVFIALFLSVIAFSAHAGEGKDCHSDVKEREAATVSSIDYGKSIVNRPGR